MVSYIVYIHLINADLVYVHIYIGYRWIKTENRVKQPQKQ